MRNIGLRLLSLAFLGLWCCAASAQVYPNIPANTVLGRLGSGNPGPPQPIPISLLGAQSLGAPPPIGSITPNTGAFTTLSASSTVSGAGFTNYLSTYLAAPAAIGGGTPAAGAFTTLHATGVFTSTVSTGTAPFTVASTTNIANLNASSLNGATFAAPGAIGGTTPSSGKFTTLTLSGSVVVPVRTAGTTNDSISATTDYFVCADNSGGAATENLPGSPATGLTFLIKDCSGAAATHNITVTPAAGNIDGSSTFVMSTNYQSIAVTYTGSQWSVN